MTTVLTGKQEIAVRRGAIRINANQNPLGPCGEAAAILAWRLSKKGGRYMKEKRYIERIWPSWLKSPSAPRDEMNKFKAAFLKVMG